MRHMARNCLQVDGYYTLRRESQRVKMLAMNRFSKRALPALSLLIAVPVLGGWSGGCMQHKTYAETIEFAAKRELKLSGEELVTTPENTPYGTHLGRDNGRRTWFNFSATADFFDCEDGRSDLFVYNPGTFTTPNATLIRYGFPPAALEPNAYQNIDYIFGFDGDQDAILVAGKEYESPNPEDPDRADLILVFTSDEASVDRDVQFVFPATVDAWNTLLGTSYSLIEDFANDPNMDPGIVEQTFFLEEDAASGRMLFDEPSSPYFADPNDLWIMILADATTNLPDGSPQATYSFQYLVLKDAASERDKVIDMFEQQGHFVSGLPTDDAEYEAQTREYIFESYLPDGDFNL